MIDYSQIKTSINSSLVVRVYHFMYVVAGKTMAHIEVLEFEADSFGSQAKLLSEYASKGSVSSGRFFKTKEEAINDAIQLLEPELLADPFVIEVQQMETDHQLINRKLKEFKEK